MFKADDDGDDDLVRTRKAGPGAEHQKQEKALVVPVTPAVPQQQQQSTQPASTTDWLADALKSAQSQSHAGATSGSHTSAVAAG